MLDNQLESLAKCLLRPIADMVRVDRRVCVHACVRVHVCVCEREGGRGVTQVGELVGGGERMVMSDGDATWTTSHVEKQSFRITRIDYINLLTVNKNKVCARLNSSG